MTTTTQDKKELTPQQEKTRKRLLRGAFIFGGTLNEGNVYCADGGATNGRCAQYDVLNAWGELLHGVALYDGFDLVTAKLRKDPKQIKGIIRQWLGGKNLEEITC